MIKQWEIRNADGIKTTVRWSDAQPNEIAIAYDGMEHFALDVRDVLALEQIICQIMPHSKAAQWRQQHG